MNDPRTMALRDIATALRTRDLRVRQLVEAAIARHGALNGSLNAYKTWAGESAMGAAAAADARFDRGIELGLLQGIPFSIKDLYGVQGMPTYAGTARRLPPRWEREGPIVETLRQQCAVIMGKSHSAECALGGLGISYQWGTPRNPWDPHTHRVPGGSSSGAGVSIIEGSSLLALGTDTGGSVRVPASMTGTVGLKCSAGRWSLEGIVPLSRMFDSAGLIGRTVGDVAWGFAGLDPAWRSFEDFETRFAAPDPAQLRIGVSAKPLWDGCSPGVVETLEQALKELERAGARVTVVAFAGADRALELLHSCSAVAAECNAFVDRELPQWKEILGPVTTRLVAEGALLPIDELQRRRALFAQLLQQPVIDFDHVDVLATPTVPISPPRLDEVKNVDDYRRFNSIVLRNTSVVNLLGLCAISLPVGLDAAGMPVGLQLIAPAGQEERLLAVAVTVESVLGTPGERIGLPPLAG